MTLFETARILPHHLQTGSPTSSPLKGRTTDPLATAVDPGHGMRVSSSRQGAAAHTLLLLQAGPSDLTTLEMGIDMTGGARSFSTDASSTVACQSGRKSEPDMLSARFTGCALCAAG